MKLIILIAVAALAGLALTQEPGPPPRVIKSDSEFRAAVRGGLATPGSVIEADDGLWVKVWGSHDKAVQIPAYFSGGSMYRVAVVIDDGQPLVLGAETMDGVRVIINAMGRANHGRRVLVAISEPSGAYRWLGADGSPCKNQDDGPQWRAVEVRVMVGSVAIP